LHLFKEKTDLENRERKMVLPFSIRYGRSSICPSCDASISGVDCPKLILVPLDKRILTTSINPLAQANVTK